MNLSDLFFFHLSKAAGTAVDHALRSHFAPERCSPPIENSQRDHEHRIGRYAAFRDYGYHNGNYGDDIYRDVAHGHGPIIRFRLPCFGRIERENVAAAGASPGIDPADRCLILRKNALDTALRDRAARGLEHWLPTQDHEAHASESALSPVLQP